MCFCFLQGGYFFTVSRKEERRGLIKNVYVCAMYVDASKRDGADALVDFLNFLRDGTALGAFLLGRGLASQLPSASFAEA